MCKLCFVTMHDMCVWKFQMGSYYPYVGTALQPPRPPQEVVRIDDVYIEYMIDLKYAESYLIDMWISQ
jgi:hypothetical protein